MARMPLLVIVALLADLTSLRAADFNGDGLADLAIGVHGEQVNGFQEAGAVHVLYGGSSCFASITDQVITEASFGTLAAPGDFELFGLAVTSGDFDGDGYDDLAIGGANEDVNGLDAAGTVFVTYGSPSGLDVARHQAFSQDTPGIKDKAEAGDFQLPNLSAEQFGRTLAAGDFNADGRDDLAIFVNETLGNKVSGKQYAGAVHVLRGSPTGLEVKGNKLFHQNSSGVPGKAISDGKFGWALAVADFDQDSIDDLAIGAPGELAPGTVTILRGKAKKGLSGKHAILIDESAAGGTPDPAKAHHFGETLAVGDFSGSGVPQLAIGAPLLDVGAVEYAGGVYVVAFTPADLAISAALVFTRATAGIEGGVHSVAEFGAALAAGDFDADGHDDLAVGCPRDTVGAVDDAGSVTVLAGADTGFFAGGLLLHQDVTDVPDVAEEGDVLGGSLAAADFDGDGDADLAIGCHGEKTSNVPNAGGVLVLEGSSSALLDLTQAHWIDKSLVEVPGNLSSNDNFGWALGR